MGPAKGGQAGRAAGGLTRHLGAEAMASGPPGLEGGLRVGRRIEEYIL